ncbi:7681_t:CDS:10 [Ambispora gerdemannii]|uniref:7681_t:CDS:1 n=1 Tax=Ambispora gerdemannii TaxID=144530 RepID=A0A9N8YQP6_9GLOM|nr:7681_t:CDS:10 [Ambispora gerdemannii]
MRLPLSIILLIVIILLLLQSANGYNTLAYTEPGHDFVQVYTKDKALLYEDGTALVRLTFGESNPQMIYLRLIYQNGSMTPIDVEISRNRSENYQVTIYPLSVGYIFAAIDNLTTNATEGMLISWNGQILQRGIDLGPYIKFKSSSYAQLNVNTAKNFLWVTQGPANSNMIFWTLFSSVGSNQTISQLKSGKLNASAGLLLRETSGWGVFPTIEGGFGIAYLARNPNINITTPVSAINNATNLGKPVIPSWYLHVVFLEVDADEFTNPIIVYQTPVIMDINFMLAYLALDGTGYGAVFCAFTADDQIYMRISFLSGGAVTNISKLLAVDGDKFYYEHIIPLPYGGFLFMVNDGYRDDYSVGLTLDNNGNGNQTWSLPRNTSNQLVGVYKNNTVWTPLEGANGTWVILSAPLPRFMPDDNGYKNPNIESTLPKLNASVSYKIPKFSIKYREEILLSSGNISIYQTNGTSQILRQSFTSQPCFIEGDDGKTVTCPVLTSTFNQPQTAYYIMIDNNFVKNKSSNQPQFGIEKNTWIMRTEKRETEFADSVNALLRLTVEGTKYFEDLSANRKNKFFEDLQNELALIIPVDLSRLSTTKRYQYDPSTSKSQILLPLKFQSTHDLDQLSTYDITDSLDTLIRNKGITAMSNSDNAKYLDEDYGLNRRPNLWDEIKFILIGVLAGVIILVILYFLAKRKHKEGRNFEIFKIILIIVDLAFDISFIINNGRDVRWLFVPSIIFLAVPVAFNATLAFSILFSEISTNENFHEWFQKFTKPAALFTLLASSDVELLTILTSQIAGLSIFSATLSDRAHHWIFWVSSCNLIIEDIPQLIIQILYKQYTVTYDKTLPLFTLITSSTILFSNIIGRVYDARLRWKKHQQYKYQTTSSHKNHQEGSDSNNDPDTYIDIPTVWRKNKFATVRWINNGPPDVKKTLIEILAGDPANLARVMVIKQSIDAKKRIFKFRVPKTLAAGTYVIRIGEIGHQVSYSHPFTVSE